MSWDLPLLAVRPSTQKHTPVFLKLHGKAVNSSCLGSQTVPSAKSPHTSGHGGGNQHSCLNSAPALKRAGVCKPRFPHPLGPGVHTFGGAPPYRSFLTKGAGDTILHLLSLSSSAACLGPQASAELALPLFLQGVMQGPASWVCTTPTHSAPVWAVQAGVAPGERQAQKATQDHMPHSRQQAVCEGPRRHISVFTQPPHTRLPCQNVLPSSFHSSLLILQVPTIGHLLRAACSRLQSPQAPRGALRWPTCHIRLLSHFVTCTSANLSPRICMLHRGRVQECVTSHGACQVQRVLCHGLSVMWHVV